MGNFTKYYKKVNIVSIMVTMVAMVISIFFMPSFIKFEEEGNNIYTVYLNEKEVGQVASPEAAEEALREARLAVAKEQDEMILVEADLKVEGGQTLFGILDSSERVKEAMKNVLKDSKKQTLNRSYTVKINEYMVNLSTGAEVVELLKASIEKYDTERKYGVDLNLNPNRELNVLTAKVYPLEEEKKQQEARLLAGLDKAIEEGLAGVEPAGEKAFSDYKLGLVDLNYEDTVEVVEAYLLDAQLTSLDTAIDQVTKEQEKEQIYEVVSGDTLSLIAMNHDLTIEKLVEMNETLENENSMIRVGDELKITVPEPELTVLRTEERYYEEDYEAKIQYVPNDDWYTTQQVTLQEPSAGHRKVVVNVSFRNDTEVNREILKEEVIMEAVPKIVEKGTKIPPTYIKPISGGRLSSTFGRRKAPTKGASTYHKGTDWATPIGTSVVASSSGTVVKAGWGKGYGYVVYINHADGRQTRYGHLSKVLVRPGQYVEQGQKIALSGNTGISSGPHVHFEILIGGSQVNALKYLN